MRPEVPALCEECQNECIRMAKALLPQPLNFALCNWFSLDSACANVGAYSFKDSTS